MPKKLDMMRFLWYNRGKKKRRNEVLQMTEKLPDNLEEALEFIKEQQAEISHLQSENTELKATVDKQNIMLSNLNEMLVKGRKSMNLAHLFAGKKSTGKRRVLTLTGRPWRTG